MPPGYPVHSDIFIMIGWIVSGRVHYKSSSRKVNHESISLFVGNLQTLKFRWASFKVCLLSMGGLNLRPQFKPHGNSMVVPPKNIIVLGWVRCTLPPMINPIIVGVSG